jgi:hypothetical protein
MSDYVGPVELATNGKHVAKRPDEGSATARSTEERLNELREAVETWDWRTALEKTEGTSNGETATTVSALGESTPVEVCPDPVEGEPDPVTVRRDSIGVRPDRVTVRRDPVQVQPDPVAVQPHLIDAALDTIVPTKLLESDSQYVNSDPLLTPEAEPEPKPSAARRLWSHRWTKATVFCLVAVVAVSLIIWVIRLAHTSPNSGGSSTTVTQPASSHVAAAPARTSFVSPITSGQMTRYNLYAYGLSQANQIASKAIVDAGAKPTTAQLSSPITAYHTAVNLYDFQLRFIQWPASMQASIADDHAQLEALVSFLASFSTTSPTNMSGWLSGLRIRTTAAQTTDNLVHRDLGLPSTNSFP